MADAEAGVAITLGSVELRLLADRAVYWPAQSTLLIADLHLGKGDAFRRAGIALPSGGTAHDLRRLSALIQDTRPTCVIVLGDLIHGPLPQAAHWRDQWAEFLQAHAAVRFEAVLGNHDRALRGAESFGRLQLLREGLQREGLHLCHEPEHAPPGQPTLCGHLHPVLRLRQPGLPPRLPAFWRSASTLVLPAFSDFTGGYPLQPQSGDSIWVCAATSVLSVPAPKRPARRR
jgi:hypothetical protein